MDSDTRYLLALEQQAAGLESFAEWLEGSLQFHEPEDDTPQEAERREIIQWMRDCAACWAQGVPYGPK